MDLYILIITLIFISVPICMPPDESDFTGRVATVTGWGRLKYGGGVPAVLQEVQVWRKQLFQKIFANLTKLSMLASTYG